MPFTLSHAAAALPFRRTRLIMSAVVVGCFAPDFEYFIPFAHHGNFGHTLGGTFEFDLPLSLAVLWLFHGFAKEPLAACLPVGARERLERNLHAVPKHSIARFAITVFSILVGIATHILWDSFTHSGYWISDHLHFLHTIVSMPLFGPRPIFEILQYFSSAFGIGAILLWYIHWYRNTAPVHSNPDRRYPSWDRIVLACSLSIATALGLFRAAASGVPHGVAGSQRFMTDVAITGITVLWIEIVIYGVVRSLIRKDRTV
ncbi:DUF4184 family protein [Telmatobacter sp. DSM 110680]|uniref:DUF4184 family protein n=1 Tax=Telmatobacter sp. DSM 110680 TaxID=3036704 RepID=A0AAU7DGF9_9BACT